MSLEISLACCDKICFGTCFFDKEVPQEQPEDFSYSHLIWVPKTIQEMNSRSEENHSSILPLKITLSDSEEHRNLLIPVFNDLNFQDNFEQLDLVPIHEDPFACFSEMTQQWISKIMQLKEEEVDLNVSMTIPKMIQKLVFGFVGYAANFSSPLALM
jgi:hypothetical protein